MFLSLGLAKTHKGDEKHAHSKKLQVHARNCVREAVTKILLQQLRPVLIIMPNLDLIDKT